MIGLLATGEDPSVHIAKLVLAGLVAVGLLVVVIYAFAAPTAGAYRLLFRRRRGVAARHLAGQPATSAPGDSPDLGRTMLTASSQEESSQ